ncbi:hypothetical protein, partial [uncultured Cyclobacterium sp.]|uniref:hypothetical protein n=1 Tax=uncultured Cyclobacterium sp. TaxID=453820 RepID=UPI0030EB58C3
MYYSGREIGYKLTEQFEDISGTILISAALFSLLYYFSCKFLTINDLWVLIIQFIGGLILFLIIALTLKLRVVDDLKEILFALKNKGVNTSNESI